MEPLHSLACFGLAQGNEIIPRGAVAGEELLSWKHPLHFHITAPPKSKNGIRVQLSLFLEPLFYVLLLSNAGFQWGFDAYLQTFVDLGLQTGVEKVLAVNLMSDFALADLFGNPRVLIN